MNSQGKKLIGTAQAVCLFILVRCFSLFSFSFVSPELANSSARLVAILIGTALGFLFFIPTYLLFRKYDRGILGVARKFGRVAEIITGLLVYGLCFFSFVILLAQFNYFLGTTIYKSGSKIIYMFILSLASFYGMKKGIEPCARAEFIFFVIIMGASLLGAIFLIPDIELVNLSSPFFYSKREILRLGYLFAVQNLPLILLLVFRDNIKGKGERVYLYYSLGAFLVFEIVFFLVITILGEFAYSKSFAIFSLAGVSKGGTLKRYDSFYMFAWIFTALVKSTMLLFALREALGSLSCSHLRGKWLDLALGATIALALGFGGSLSKSSRLFERAIGFNSVGALFLAVGVVLPMILAIKNPKNKKNKRIERKV